MTFIPQSMKDEIAAAQARPGFLDKKQWFYVPDSEMRDDDGDGTGEYNVQARFADHPVLNVEKSKIARHNVFDLGIVLHTRVLRQADEAPALKNGSSHVMRFDKGADERVASYRPGPDGKEVIHYDGRTGMGKEAFDAATKDIARCWDAWQHYQKFRKAPVHPMELKALGIINSAPLNEVGTIMIDMGDGKLGPHREDASGEDDDDPLPPPLKTKTSRKKKA